MNKLFIEDSYYVLLYQNIHCIDEDERDLVMLEVVGF